MATEHDKLEVITGELSVLTEEVIRQRREQEIQAENAEIRLRAMEQHLDRPLKDRLWSAFVLTMLITAVFSVAACLSLLVWWAVT